MKTKPEHKIIERKGIFFPVTMKRRKKYYFFGKVISEPSYFYEARHIPLRFNNLKEAQDYIDLVKKGEIFHNA